MKQSRLIVLNVMLALVCMAFFITRAYAQSSAKADPRMKKALDAMGYKYVVTDLGNYTMTFNIPKKKRGHRVFIASRTETYGFYEIRKIWAVAHKSRTEYSADFCRALLKENTMEKVGTWEISESKDEELKYRLKYVARVPADLPVKHLQPVISAVMLTADRKEAKVSKYDEY